MTFFVDGIAPHRKVVPPEQPGPWWWACSQPERPADGWSLYLTDCNACQIALAAHAVNDPGSTLDWHGDGSGVPTETDIPVAEIVERTGASDRWPVPKRIPSDR